jgi:hypothetical protein
VPPDGCAADEPDVDATAELAAADVVVDVDVCGFTG